MGAALLVSGLMAVGTVIIHMLGLMVALGLFLIHAIEMLAYAALYYGLGEFLTFEEALYFSVSTFTTLGMGDIYIESQWRLVAAIEGFNGFLLIGWSTAFLVTVIGRLRAIEFDWLDRLGDEED